MKTNLSGPKKEKKAAKPKTTKVLPKKNNAGNGKKAHNDNAIYKVGRIRYGSWATQILQSRDIVVSERELVHIHNYHSAELETVGMTAFDFVKFVVNNFNAIYRGSGNSYLLVVKRQNTSSQAAIEITILNNKEKYQIKTAEPVKTRRLISKKLLCANVR